MNTLNKTIVCLIVCALFTACQDSLVEVNENPNAPTNIQADFLLPNTIKSTADLIYAPAVNLNIGTHLTQGTTETYIPSYDRYEFQAFLGGSGNLWPEFYKILENLRLIKEAAIAEENANKEAIATIMMVWNFQLMTDLWGDIPYSEALQGQGEEENLTPQYDTQETIYNNLITDLNSAINKINVNESSFGSNDIIYGGDMTNWLKFGNSLKLRLYMRLAEVNPSLASQGISDTYNDGNGQLIESNSENAEFHYSPYPNNHPINDELRNRDDYRMSKTLIDTLKAFNDPRLRIYAIPTENNDDYQGAPNGLPDAHNFQIADLSQIGAYFESPTAPAFFMRYSEVQFILAEAAARNWIQADAETLYNNAIRASMEGFTDARITPVLDALEGTRAYDFQKLNASEFPVGITESEISQYLSQPSVQFDPSTWREQIGLQKWIALFGEGLQRWVSWKRIGFPNLEAPELADYDEVPIRLPYPTIERSLNGEHYEEAVSRQGADDIITPVWWDVN